jgi:DNA-binding CsgD family transcriptional regulator/PAS domain-containing protein
MSLETKVPSKLIGNIYDTALDATLWPGVLKNLTEFVGGAAAAIYCKSPVAAGAAYHQFGFDPHYQQLYFSKYIRFDPSMTGHCLADIGQLVAMGDIMPYRELHESRFHQEWAAPQGLMDSLTTPLEKSAASVALFSLLRHEDHGVVDDEARRRGCLIAPHVRRAALIGNVLGIKTAETTAFMEALNGLAAAVFLVARNGRVVFANPSGQAMLEDGRILRLRNDALATADSRPALADVIAAAGEGDAGVGVSGIAVPLSAPPQAPWLAHVLPLTSGARRETGISFAAVAAVFVHQTSLAVPSAIESMSKLYGLTPAELRVLAAVSEFDGIAAVADAVGISQATVKTHLQRVFAKTGTNRQTELIKLVAAHAGPLRRQ